VTHSCSSKMDHIENTFFERQSQGYPRAPADRPLARPRLGRGLAPGTRLCAQGSNSGGPALEAFRGRLPLARALCRTASARSAISSRSSSETAPRTLKAVLSVGVLVYTCSESETNSMPRARSRCDTGLAKRSRETIHPRRSQYSRRGSSRKLFMQPTCNRPALPHYVTS
jgi:hypothetical protein